MAADGVSLPTTIAQMGSVAKTQVKGQQTTQATTPFAEQLENKEDLKVQRVKEAEKAEKKRIDPDAERKDKRQRRRQRRRNKLLADLEDGERDGQPGEAAEDETGEQEAPDSETLGSLIDLRV